MNAWLENDWSENKKVDQESILVTGYQGFVGSRYWELYRGKQDLIGLEKGAAYKDYVSKLNSLVKLHKIKTIIHAGAISNNQHKNMEELKLWIYDATKEIVDHVKGIDGYLVYLSSASVLNPNTDYGKLKKKSERYIMNNLNSDQYCILRPYNVYGDTEWKKPYGTRSLYYMLKKESISEVWDTERDYIYVDDVCHLIGNCVNKKISGVYEVGTGKSVPAKVIVSVFKLADTVKIIKTPKHIVKKSVSNKCNWVPGWSPMTNILDKISMHLGIFFGRVTR